MIFSILMSSTYGFKQAFWSNSVTSELNHCIMLVLSFELWICNTFFPFKIFHIYCFKLQTFFTFPFYFFQFFRKKRKIFLEHPELFKIFNANFKTSSMIQHHFLHHNFWIFDKIFSNIYIYLYIIFKVFYPGA